MMTVNEKWELVSAIRANSLLIEASAPNGCAKQESNTPAHKAKARPRISLVPMRPFLTQSVWTITVRKAIVFSCVVYHLRRGHHRGACYRPSVYATTFMMPLVVAIAGDFWSGRLRRFGCSSFWQSGRQACEISRGFRGCRKGLCGDMIAEGCWTVFVLPPVIERACEDTGKCGMRSAERGIEESPRCDCVAGAC